MIIAVDCKVTSSPPTFADEEREQKRERRSRKRRISSPLSLSEEKEREANFFFFHFRLVFFCFSFFPGSLFHSLFSFLLLARVFLYFTRAVAPRNGR